MFSLLEDLRVVMTLNRGTLSCLSGIPVLDGALLDEQLDQIAHQFVSTFVEAPWVGLAADGLGAAIGWLRQGGRGNGGSSVEPQSKPR